MSRVLLTFWSILLFVSLLRAENVAQRQVVIGEKNLTPQTLDVDAAGNVYVGGGDEIWVYDNTGNRIAVWQFPAARPVRMGPDGRLYVGRTWERDSQIRRLDPSGRILDALAVNKWLHGDAVGFDVPIDLLFDADGNMWSLNTHSTEQDERRKDVPNTAWGGRREDVNGGRLMFFDLQRDPTGRNPKYFGTFSNTPPEAGGPADGLHRPRRLVFDSIKKKIFVLDDWGVTRWNWPDAAFEKRIIRTAVDYLNGLIAMTPQGTLYLSLKGSLLQEYDSEGTRLADLPEIDVRGARDLRVTPAGEMYLCYPDAKICYKKYGADRTLLQCRGLNVLTLKLATEQTVYPAGTAIPVTALVEDRQNLYGHSFPELAEVGRSLWYRAYTIGARWQPVTIETGEDGREMVTLPTGLQGALQLRLSANPVVAEVLDESDAGVEINLALYDPAAKGSLTVLADRGQREVCAGEWLRLLVVGRAQQPVAQEEVRLTLSPQTGNAVAHTAAWAIPAGGSATLAFDVRLQVGVYTVSVFSPSFDTARYLINVVPAQERGRFKFFSALGLGNDFSRATTQSYIDTAADYGITHDVTRYISANYQFGNNVNDLQRNAQMRALLAADPRLPAPETAELPTRLRLALEGMGRAGMRIWPEMMGWENDTVNRTETQSVMDRENLSKWTLWGLKSPAHDGFLWNESNWWGVDHRRLQQEWSASSGKTPDLLNGLQWQRLQEYSPLLSGEKLTNALDYHAYMAKHLYPVNYRAWKAYVQTMRPRITGAGVPALYPINWPEWSSAELGAVMSYHQVEQVCEPYMQLNDGAFMRHDGKPFWAGVEIAPEPGTGEYLARQLLPALLYGAEGFWANDMHNFQQFMGLNTAKQMSRAGHRAQAAADLRSVLEPVGMRLRDTRYRALFGIYLPRAAFVQQGNPAFRGDSYNKRVSAALIASFHAHLPARIVYDEELRLGTVTDIQYLLLPGLRSEITAADRAALQAFTNRGGTVLLGADSAEIHLPLGKTLDVDFSIFRDDDYSDWFTQDSRVEKRLRVLALAAAMRKALSPYLQPLVRVDDPDIWYALRDGKDNRERPLAYLITLNQNFPENLTMAQLWKMTSSYSAVLPVMRSARVPREYTFAYDLLAGKPLPVVNGMLALDFRRFPARVIALSTAVLTAADLRERAVNAAKPAAMISATPAVDIFFTEKIREALQAADTTYVTGGNPARRAQAVEALTVAGVKAEAINKVEDQHGAFLVLATPGNQYWQDRDDLLPVRLTENMPGRGQALLTFVPAYLPGGRSAMLLAAGDDDGWNSAIAEVGKLARLPAPQNTPDDWRLAQPAYQPAPPASLTEDTTRHWGARLSVIKSAGDTVAVGAAEWGNNLFLLDASTGAVRAAVKAGRFYVDRLWMTPDGVTIGAEAIYPEDVNGYLELVDRTGQAQARFARDGVNSHANFNYVNHTMRTDIFDFAISPNGEIIYSSSNLGLSALTRKDGRLRWRLDWSSENKGLGDLRNRWAGRLDLAPNGATLAVALTHELNRSPDDLYRGTSKVLLVDTATGGIRWAVELEPIQRPHLSTVAISPDGATVAVLDDYHGLLLLREGKLIKQRKGEFLRLAWSENGAHLYALARNGDREGVQALSPEGALLWQYDQESPIIALAPTPRGVVISDGARRITLIESGRAAAVIKMTATCNIAVSRDALYACDWHGGVYRFTMEGRQLWEQNVTEHVWRADIEELPARPFAGPTFGRPQRVAQQFTPLEGENLAVKSTVRAGGISGWFATGRVRIEGKQLADGLMNDLAMPWLSPTDQYKAGNWSRVVWAEFTWPRPVTINGLSVHEDERFPESVPYHACVQVWRDSQWQDITVSQMMPATPWRTIPFPEPLQADKIRYVVTGCLSNNVCTDEIQVIGTE